MRGLAGSRQTLSLFSWRLPGKGSANSLLSILATFFGQLSCEKRRIDSNDFSPRRNQLICALEAYRQPSGFTDGVLELSCWVTDFKHFCWGSQWEINFLHDLVTHTCSSHIVFKVWNDLEEIVSECNKDKHLSCESTCVCVYITCNICCFADCALW
jgi:hypothetical protein